MRNPIIETRFARFLGTGVVNTGFGYAVFILGLAAGLEPGAALALQFALGIPFNYLMHGRLVFGTRGISRLPLYAIAYLGLYAVNLFCLRLLSDALAPALAQALLIGPMAILSFLVLSRLMEEKRR